MASGNWTMADMPDQHGRQIIVTGANSGIGYETVRALAARGAQVTLAVRNAEKGQAAVERLTDENPQAAVEVMPLNLADLASVRQFAEAWQQRSRSLSLLINNAGVMAIPFRRTADGFEMQFGTNHLGHFALTGLLLPTLLATPDARVVTVSSMNHMAGSIQFDNLDGAKDYRVWRAYGQSKLANILFAYELDRRLRAAGASTISVACHPGYAATNLQAVGPQMSGSRFMQAVFQAANRLFAQSAAMGALPVLYAATAPEVVGGDYIGPRQWGGAHGYPGKARSSPRSYDADLAKRLWDASETLTGVHYDALKTPPVPRA